MKLNNYEIKVFLKWILLVFAFLIGFFSLWYTNNLVKKLADQEREKIETWVNATRLVADPSFDGNVNFLLEIIEKNTTIPVILAVGDSIVDSRNLDSARYSSKSSLYAKADAMDRINEPISVEFDEDKQFTVHYENSTLLHQLKIYPYFQLGVIALFLAMSYFAFSYSRTSEQNKVWAGMSKETAHQLGTPISSLVGWLEYIKESEGKVSPKVVGEMQHDLTRLELITERFSKIGSEPVLESISSLDVLTESVNYINSRTSDKVKITISNPDDFAKQSIMVNKPLFAWVVENLCKNAVDAMKGEGSVSFSMAQHPEKVIIDIADTGSGIPSNKFKRVFKPGFTTKKRGWGLGLSLVKRIIENYHGGKIYVKSSELGKGTTFRIELKAQ